LVTKKNRNHLPPRSKKPAATVIREKIKEETEEKKRGEAGEYWLPRKGEATPGPIKEERRRLSTTTTERISAWERGGGGWKWHSLPSVKKAEGGRRKVCPHDFFGRGKKREKSLVRSALVRTWGQLLLI